MNDEERRAIQDYLPVYAAENLTPIRGSKGCYICPFCGHGQGSKCFRIYTHGGTWYFKCHHGECLRGGDFFTFIAYRDGIDIHNDFSAVVKAAAQAASVTLQDSSRSSGELLRERQYKRQLKAVKADLSRWYTSTSDTLRSLYCTLADDLELSADDPAGRIARMRIDEIEQLYNLFQGQFTRDLLNLYNDKSFNDRIAKMQDYLMKRGHTQ